MLEPAALVRVSNERQYYTPWRAPDYQLIIRAMDNKTWLIEMAVAACLTAMALVAFTLMVGHNLWKNIAGK